MESPTATRYARASAKETPFKTKFDEPHHELTTVFDAAMFTAGAWETELLNTRLLSGAQRLMISCLPCISIAQVSARINGGSFQKTLWGYTSLSIATVVLVVAAVVLYCDWATSQRSRSTEFLSTTSGLVTVGLICAIIIAAITTSKMIVTVRAKVRSRFQIPGTSKDDWLSACCFSSCAIGQMVIQVKSFTPEQGFCDFNAPEELPAYIP